METEKTIWRKAKEPDAEWEKVTKEEAIQRLEGSGHWKASTVEAMLKGEMNMAWTPFANYTTEPDKF
jgi:hypothetical protein